MKELEAKLNELDRKKGHAEDTPAYLQQLILNFKDDDKESSLLFADTVFEPLEIRYSVAFAANLGLFPQQVEQNGYKVWIAFFVFVIY